MESQTQHGYIVLADISGFDAYLAGVELEHAQGVLAELLELIVDHLAPPLQLASLEGDAVLAYAAEGQLARGETLLELIETAYSAFRGRLESIRRSTTCGCRACLTVPSLDLKFIVHYGEYVARPIDGRVELTGLDANLVRERVLKGQVADPEEQRAYALFTEQSLAHLALRPDGMRPNNRSYPHFGEVLTACLDLRPRYQAMVEARRVFVAPEEADLTLSQEVAAPPAVVWEWLNEPNRRTQWMKWRTWSAGLRPGGRTAPGARNHCAHGVGTIIETVLDWRPFEYFTVELRPPSESYKLLQTYRLEPLPGGGETRLTQHSRLERPRWLARPAALAGLLFKNDLGRLAQLIAAKS